MAKLFAIEEFEAPVVAPEAAYLDGAADHELLEIVESDADVAVASVATVSDEQDAIDNGVVAVAALEKLSRMAKSALVGPNKGFTPGEAEAINFGLEAISTLLGSPKPILTLKTTNFATESLATRTTTSLSMSQEGIMDAINSIIKSVGAAFSRKWVSTKRFFEISAPAMFRAKKMAERLQKRISEAREKGLTPTSPNVNSYNVAELRLHNSEVDITSVVNGRSAVLGERLESIGGIDPVQLVEAAVNKDAFSEYFHKTIVPNITGGMVKSTDSNLKRRMEDAAPKGMGNFDLWVTKSPVSVRGSVVALAVSSSPDQVVTEEDISNSLNTSFFSKVLPSYADKPTTAEVPVFTLDEMDAMMNAIVTETDSAMSSGIETTQTVLKEMAYSILEMLFTANLTDEEKATIVDVNSFTSKFTSFIANSSVVGLAISSAVNVDLGGLFLAVGGISLTWVIVQFVTRAALAATAKVIYSRWSFAGKKRRYAEGISAAAANGAAIKLIGDMNNLLTNLRVEMLGAVMRDNRLMVRATYECLQVYGAVQEKLDLETDDTDLAV